MANSLIEKMAKRICRQSCPFTGFGSNCEHQCMATPSGLGTRDLTCLARDTLTDVLDHFSDPENIKYNMVNAARCSFKDDGYLPARQANTPFDALCPNAIAAAMKAAKEELK